MQTAIFLRHCNYSLNEKCDNHVFILQQAAWRYRQETQLMLTNRMTRLEVSQGHQTDEPFLRYSTSKMP